MKDFNETADGRIIVTDDAMYSKALTRYRTHCKNHGFEFQQPSPRLTEFKTDDNSKIEVILHNNETYRKSIDDTSSKLFSTKIRVTNDENVSYVLHEKGIRI